MLSPPYHLYSPPLGGWCVWGRWPQWPVDRFRNSVAASCGVEVEVTQLTGQTSLWQPAGLGVGLLGSGLWTTLGHENMTTLSKCALTKRDMYF